MQTTTLTLLSLLPLLLLASCGEQQVTSTSRVFTSESENLSFRYPSTWEPVEAQAKSALVLLYARDGSLATCNVSVIPSDRDHADDFDAAYFSSILSQIQEGVRIKRTWQRNVLGQEMALAECDFTMPMPERTAPMSSLIMATVQDNKRYMMILNAPRDRLPGLHDDFEVMVSTFFFSRRTSANQISQETTGRFQTAIPLSQQSVALHLEGKAKPIGLLVPSEFRTASADSEIAVRDRQLSALNSNPGRRTRYSDWMVYDWNAPEKMPWLMVTSIGGLIKHQGAIPQAEWERLKAEMVALEGKNLEAISGAVEKRIREGAKSDYDIAKRQVADLFVSDSTSVTCVVDFVTNTEFGQIDAWGAMKLLYTDRSVATVYIYVPKDYPDALRLLQSLAQRTSAR